MAHCNSIPPAASTLLQRGVHPGQRLGARLQAPPLPARRVAS